MSSASSLLTRNERLDFLYSKHIKSQPAQLDAFVKPDPSYIMHYGTGHVGSVPHSGRYKWGSGLHPHQHESWFAGFGEKGREYFDKYQGNFNKCYNDLLHSGMTKAQICEKLGIDAKTLDARLTLGNAQFMVYQKQEAIRIKNENPTLSNQAIADILGIKSEGTIRNFFKTDKDHIARATETLKLVNDLKARVDEYGFVDVSEGNEHWMNITRSRLEQASLILKDEGYVLENIKIPQIFSTNATTMSVLAKPGTEWSEIRQARDDGKIVPTFDPDINEDATLLGLKYPPQSIDSSRIGVRYAEDGGEDNDGLIEIRRGVADIALTGYDADGNKLGNPNYAQVRIAVDGTHYIKGVAAYSDNLPPGVDILVNSNKKSGTPLTDPDPDAKQVLKPMKLNEDGSVNMLNPFGASIKGDNGQYFYIDKDGNQKLSCINKVNEEGDWANWSKTVASQMLSKQPLTIAQEQLDITKAAKRQGLENIKNIENPVIREKMLIDYADGCDNAAVELKASPFHGQQTHVILPLNSIAENEVYAPNYKDGTHLILIRYPHASIREIPYLTVNNKNAEGDNLIGKNAKDAIGIHHKTAVQLSGADYDGDTVLCIPADSHDFRFDKPFKELVEFDTKKAYPPIRDADGKIISKTMNKKIHGQEMGYVTNLITDMTLAGAPSDDLCKAIRHSMVVVDSLKHKLNYQQSYVDNDIARLYKDYLGTSRRGGTTLLSKASGRYDIPEQKEGGWVTDKATGKQVWKYIDPETGKKLYTPTGATTKSGKTVMQKSTKMAATDDANTLVKGYPMEKAYADYANFCKGLGNEARLESLRIKDKYEVNPSAANAYKKEAASISEKILLAKKHSPLERQALMVARRTIDESLKKNPSIKDDDDDYKKLKTQALAGARNRFGGGREKITLTDKEWEAVDSRAVNKTTLTDLLKYMDSRALKDHVLSSSRSSDISASVAARIRSMAAKNDNGDRGYTNEEIANIFGISVSTVHDIIS